MEIDSRLIVIHGDKGGVGKSLVSKTLIDYLIHSSTRIAFIDADSRNNDVRRMYAEYGVPNIFLNLNHNPDDWLRIADFVEDNPECVFVMNTPSNIGAPMEEHFTKSRIRSLGIPVDLFFVVNRAEPESTNSLNEALEKIGHRFHNKVLLFNTFYDPIVEWKEGAISFAFPKMSIELETKKKLATMSLQDAITSPGVLRRGEKCEVSDFLNGDGERRIGTRQLFEQIFSKIEENNEQHKTPNQTPNSEVV